MSVFNVEIEYPIHINGQDKVLFADVMDSDVLFYLDQMKWRQYRLLQLQTIGHKTVFNVSCLEQEHEIRLTLLETTESGRIELKFETNIVILEPKKDLFGLMTRQVKDYVRFDRLTIEDARHYLTCIMLHNVDAVVHAYKSDPLKHKAVA